MSTNLGCEIFPIMHEERFWTANLTFCLSKDSSNVNVSLHLTSSGTGIVTLDWTMYLERYYSGSGWRTVGTRTGYVSDTSPSHRTFTNVGGHGSQMRVAVYLPRVGTAFRYFTR